LVHLIGEFEDMRHKRAGRKLNRTTEHRRAMRRNLVCSLIEHETVSTTIDKAKDARVLVERLITFAKKGTLAARRRSIALLGDRDIIDYDDKKPVKKGTVIGKLFSELGPRYLDRPGGYTRIIRLSLRRLGDNGKLVLLQLVGAEGVKEEQDEAMAVEGDAASEQEIEEESQEQEGQSESDEDKQQ